MAERTFNILSPQQTARAPLKFTLPESNRQNRVERFEQIRSRAINSISEPDTTERTAQELLLVRTQAAMEAKLRERGVLPTEGYSANGSPGASSHLGRVIDLYA